MNNSLLKKATSSFADKHHAFKLILKRKLNNYQIIILAYVLFIFLGALLLSMPFSSKGRTFTPFIDALFTATSATCVTGLIVYDTYPYWSVFGQLVILFLIQIGGIGFMTMMTLFLTFIKNQLSLSDKVLFMNSIGNYEISGTKRLVRQIIIGTLIIEGFGVFLLSFSFCRDFGFGRGLYFALFHSVSAFCNAGFDLLGIITPYSSVIPYAQDPVVMLTLSFLIIMGGIGFLVWRDLLRNTYHWRKYSLHTKITLIVSFLLITIGALLFFAFEHNASMAGMSGGKMLLVSIFQSVTARTAGFTSINIAELSESGRLLTEILMFIGGSSGSTAGGIKTTTFAVLLLTIIASVKRHSQIRLYKRRLEDGIGIQAGAIVTMYGTAFILGAIIIAAIQPLQMKDVIFECISAVATVGLSTGITASLNVVSKLIIILLMFGGRVGMLTLAMIFASKKTIPPINRPTEKIILG